MCPIIIEIIAMQKQRLLPTFIGVFLVGNNRLGIFHGPHSLLGVTHSGKVLISIGLSLFEFKGFMINYVLTTKLIEIITQRRMLDTVI